MSDEAARWDRVKRVFQAALDRPPEERSRYLHETCGDDQAMRNDVESLLVAHGNAGDFAEQPAIDGFVSGPVRVTTRGDAVAVEPVLQPGLRLGPYEVVAPIGRGGMGEVYRARDTRLGRTVALKVLPAHVANDAGLRHRFEREAKILASLNHPNIAIIYGLERADGILALVMELVDGPTVAERISQGPIPVDEALSIAKQIAEALETAHEHGIIHRDLKPANVKVRTDSTVKVLDFGLAKFVAADASHDAANSLAARALPASLVTGTGIVLGTAAYMPPEQARGRNIDKRADIWAFGCILFEMLTGERAFRGETTSDVLAAVIHEEPDWGLLPSVIPPGVRAVLGRCLQKDPVERLRDIADARFRLQESVAEDVSGLGSARRFRSAQRLAWVSGLLLATMVALATWTIWRPRAQAPEVRLEVTTPSTTNPQSLAISPDGRTLVFVATSEGKPRLWLRRLDEPTLRVLAGTDDATLPFWSPDGRSLGFSVESDLKRIDLDSGAVQTVSPYNSMFGGAWLEDGTILATPNAAAPLVQVAPGGGRVSPVTQVTARAFGHRSPQMLPDGRHFLCFAGGADAGIHLGQLGEPTTRKILDATAAVYSPTGHLLFVRQGNLFSQPFDVTRLEVAGAPTLIAQNIVLGPINGVAALAVSAAGPIVYRTGGAGPRRQLMWVDRSGKQLDILSRVDEMGGIATSLSPDDAYVAWTRGPANIWLFDLARGVSTRFTFEPSVDLAPVWAPDAQRIVYGAYNDSDFDLFMKSLTGSSTSERLLRAPGPQQADDWSPDGQVVLYTNVSKGGENMSPSEIWALPLDGSRTPFPVVRTAGVAANAEFSPTGKWVAFQLNESNRFEVYVQPFPHGDKVRISTDGGVQPRWRADGKELFYIDADNRLMAVPVDLESVRTPKVGSPVPLFTPFWSLVPHHPTIKNYSVSRDGQRFLVDVYRETTSPVTVLLNWQPEG